ncbi:MAG: hypothetical protein M0P47_09400 [Bacteroidales bacterium]|nr:hypothetical protein [Bacteroidales bacterium]
MKIISEISNGQILVSFTKEEFANIGKLGRILRALTPTPIENEIENLLNQSVKVKEGK